MGVEPRAGASTGIERSPLGIGELDVDRELVGRRRARGRRRPGRRRARRRAQASSARERLGRCRAPRHASTSVRSERFASLFALRISPSTSARPRYTAGSSAPNAASSSAVGHGARCTEPSRHHDHTSSVTNGRSGANSRSSVSSATASAARPTRAVVADRAVGALLHQLEVVVAEAPEEPLGALERAGVVVRRRTTSVASSTSSASVAEHRPVERLGDRVDRRRRRRPIDAERELRRVEDLDREPAPDLHLAFVERGVDARAARSPPSSAPRRRRTARAAPSA